LSLLSDVAVLFGVVAAYCQLKAWRIQKVAERKAETADRVLSDVYALHQLIRSTRLYFISTKNLDDVRYQAERKHIYLADNAGLIASLKKSWPLLYALTEDQSYKAEIEKLIQIYTDLHNALILISSADVSGLLSREEITEARLQFEGSEGDQKDLDLTSVIGQLEAFLFPIVQMK